MIGRDTIADTVRQVARRVQVEPLRALVSVVDSIPFRALARDARGAIIADATISLVAADRTGKNMPATPIDLFAGMQSGDLQVKFIPKNDRDANLVITNET